MKGKAGFWRGSESPLPRARWVPLSQRLGRGRLVLLFSTLLLAGCEEETAAPLAPPARPPEDPLVEKKTLDISLIPALAAKLEKVVEQRPEGNFVVRGTETPYSGVYYAVGQVDGGEVYKVATIKDGQLVGTGTVYRPDGLIVGEVDFRDGKSLQESWKHWNRGGKEAGPPGDSGE